MSFIKRNFRLLLCALAVLLLVTGISAYFGRTTIPTGSWGLSFQKEGQAPIGNATESALRQYDAVYKADGTEKVLYITFDAGYENGNTSKILDVLKQHSVPATFFVVGPYLEQNPELVKRMVSEGHIVGNHTYHHYDMSKISDPDTFAKELQDVADKYQQITGQQMLPYYRPPQGIYSEENLKLAQSLGYRTVFWSLAYVDWLQDKQPSKDEAFSKLIPRIHDGAIVLLHSTSSTNAEILDELLTKWEELGYRFGSIEDLFA